MIIWITGLSLFLYNIGARVSEAVQLVVGDLQVDHRARNEAVFLSQHRNPYIRFGVYRLIKHCAARIPTLGGRIITPHVIRHTNANHLLQSGVDFNTIRVWLAMPVSIPLTSMSK